MLENKLEKCLFVSWRPLRKAFNPNRVKLISTPVLKIVTDPEGDRDLHLDGLRNNKLTFVGADKQDICRLDRGLTPSHFNLSRDRAGPEQGVLFSKITIKLSNISDLSYSVEIVYHHDDF